MFKKYNPRFWSLFSGQTVSNIGDQIYLIALPWMVYDLTHSNVAMGTISAVNILPQIFLGMFIGLLVDRLSKIRLMKIAVFINTLLMLSITLLGNGDWLSIFSLSLLTFCYSTNTLIFLTCYRSIIPSLISKEEITSANALIQRSLTLIKIVGPLLAGVLISTVNGFNSLIFNAISFVFLFMVLVFLRLPEQKTDTKKGIKQELKDGFSFLVNNKTIFHLNILSLIINIGLSIGLSFMVFFLREDNGMSAQKIGYIYALSGGLSFLFTFLTSVLTKYFSTFTSVLVSCTMASIGLILLPMFSSWYVIGTCLGVVIGGSTLATIFINSHFQKEVPANLLGRVFATSQMIARTATPISLFVGGWLTQWYMSLGTLFFFSGLIVMISSLFFIVKYNFSSHKKEATIHG